MVTSEKDLATEIDVVVAGCPTPVAVGNVEAEYTRSLIPKGRFADTCLSYPNALNSSRQCIKKQQDHHTCLIQHIHYLELSSCVPAGPTRNTSYIFKIQTT